MTRAQPQALVKTMPSRKRMAWIPTLSTVAASFGVVVLSAAPAAAASALAWFRVADVPAQMERLEAVGWSLPASGPVHNALRQWPRTAPVLFAWHRPTAAEPPVRTWWSSGQDASGGHAAALARVLKAAGYVPKRAAATGSAGRIWVSAEAPLAPLTVRPHSGGVVWGPDGETSGGLPSGAWRETLAVSGGSESWGQSFVAAAAGGVALPRVYGWLEQLDNAQELSGWLSRLGLAQAGELRGHWGPAKAIRGLLGTIHAENIRGERGLFETLGPAAPLMWHRPRIPGWSSHSEFWVRPAALYGLVKRVLAYIEPLSFTVMHASLGDMQDTLGIDLTRQVFGQAPERWRLTTLYRQGHHEVVLRARLAAPEKLKAFLAPIRALLQELAPAVRITPRPGAGRQVWRVSVRGRAAFIVQLEANALWVASTGGLIQALRAAPRQAMRPPQKKTGVGWGVVRHGGRLLQPGRALGALFGGRWPEPLRVARASGAGGETVWRLRADAADVTLDTLTTGH